WHRYGVHLAARSVEMGIPGRNVAVRGGRHHLPAGSQSVSALDQSVHLRRSWLGHGQLLPQTGASAGTTAGSAYRAGRLVLHDWSDLLSRSMASRLARYFWLPRAIACL